MSQTQEKTIVHIGVSKHVKAVRFADGKTLRIYDDHPSYDDIDRYKMIPTFIVYDSKGTIRDFYNEKDQSFVLRITIDNAGGFQKTDMKRREKINELYNKISRIKRPGETVEGCFKKYPFIVMEIPADVRALDLSTAVKLARKFGVKEEKICKGMLEYDILRKGDKGFSANGGDGGGHTCYPAEEYLSNMAREFGERTVEEQMAVLLNKNRLYTVVKNNTGMVCSKKAMKYNVEITKFLRQAGCTEQYDDMFMGVDGLSDRQTEAMERGLNNKCTVIIGSAGCGKTRVVEAMRKSAIVQKKRIEVVAPTGKAARKIEGASTVHSFLATYDKCSDSDLHKHHEIEGAIVVVDETSMLDFTMAYKLIKFANDNDIKLVFVGDHEQLPSVEWGVVLFDLIEWAKNTNNLVHLQTVYRQGEKSGVLEVADAIRTGNRLPDKNFHDVEFLETVHKDEVIAIAKRFSTEAQIITPTNSIRKEINMAVLGRFTLECGDKVVCTKNQEKGGAKNGDIGIITRLADPPKIKTIRIKLEDGTGCEVATKDLEHAYCITVHKSQGSEWDTVVFVTTGMFPGTFFNKRLVYTAVTRAKKRLVVLGDKRSFERASKYPSPIRHTIGFGV